MNFNQNRIPGPADSTRQRLVEIWIDQIQELLDEHPRAARLEGVQFIRSISQFECDLDAGQITCVSSKHGKPSQNITFFFSRRGFR